MIKCVALRTGCKSDQGWNCQESLNLSMDLGWACKQNDDSFWSSKCLHLFTTFSNHFQVPKASNWQKKSTKILVPIGLFVFNCQINLSPSLRGSKKTQRSDGREHDAQEKGRVPCVSDEFGHITEPGHGAVSQMRQWTGLTRGANMKISECFKVPCKQLSKNLGSVEPKWHQRHHPHIFDRKLTNVISMMFKMSTLKASENLGDWLEKQVPTTPLQVSLGASQRLLSLGNVNPSILNSQVNWAGPARNQKMKIWKKETQAT